MSLTTEADAEEYLKVHCNRRIIPNCDTLNVELKQHLTTALTFETDKLQKILIMIREFLSFANKMTTKTELLIFIHLAKRKITNEQKKGVDNAEQKLIALQKKYKHATSKRDTIEKQIVIIEKARTELERLHANIAINKNIV